MNMFVTNPAKDIMSSFFSTILNEVKSALLLVFKAIVKCLCVRVTFKTRYEAALFLFAKNAKAIGSFNTISQAPIYYDNRQIDHYSQIVLLPSGLFRIDDVFVYFAHTQINKDKDKDLYYVQNGMVGEFNFNASDHSFSTFAYVLFWNLNKFKAMYTEHARAIRNAADRDRDISDDEPVNANVINELRMIRKWSRTWLWHHQRSIPFTQGVVLYGPPGSGKSTIAKTISLVTGFHIKPISLRCTAHDFLKTMSEHGPRSLLLIEDIDAVFHGRENVCDLENGLDFSTFINALSGVNSEQDYILVITTNRPELLDSALALIPPHGDPVPRPGRIDRVVYVGPLEPDARLKVCKRVLPDRPDLWNDLVLAGEGEVIANFQARCVRVALDLKWAELTKD